MIFQFQEYLTFENIYLWSNLGVLPVWLMLIAIPGSRITQILKLQHQGLNYIIGFHLH